MNDSQFAVMVFLTYIIACTALGAAVSAYALSSMQCQMVLEDGFGVRHVLSGECKRV